ncbi:N,N-dimethylformamidase beta subunit family domain-containing protein [Lentzea kentuckyensis]|uniref:N,N-dimethylformamidase beta subunit family domain-containing protein n=1 Tax=Lentzea kentuckyensis TaxID=360086 RepID=UPI000A36E721|nr:N,N-dimethylformamidase beta subunit family domain-containing protein [Lentzea kentuckyensis]
MAITGYASLTSVLPGQPIDFHLSTDTPGPANLVIERVGTPTISASISTNLVTLVPLAAGWEGFGWPAASTFVIPIDWPSGVYRLRDAAADVLTFVVPPSVPAATTTVLLHIPFLTYAAYNAAGGKSLYGFNSSPSGQEGDRASVVSFDRPFDQGPPGLGAEAALVDWLEHEGIGVDCCSSVDLHATSDLLHDYECLVLAGHDEYWTKPMRDQVERFVSNGGNLIVLSGNTCYRAVRLEQNDRQVVFYKYAGDDPHPQGDEVTVAWAEPPVNRPQNTLLGTGFTDGAFGGPQTPLTVRFPSHWVFDGLNHPTTTSAFMDYETDAAAYVDEQEGYPRVTGEEGTPLTFTILASADLRGWGGKPGRVTTGVFSRNGTVFNAATTDWIRVLGSDPVVTTVTRNVFARLSRRVPWDWEHIGHANQGRALTSLSGKLYIATTDNRLWRRYPVGADVPWRDIGHANHIIALAGSGDTLFCVTDDNRLWWREPVETDTGWTPIGTGPALGTKALAAASGMLYASDPTGALWRAPASRAAPAWNPMAFFAPDPAVNAMASLGDILVASTADNRLLRSNRDWINESSGWHAIHHCDFSVGLAVVDWKLFVATSEDRLWSIDLWNLRQP